MNFRDLFLKSGRIALIALSLQAIAARAEVPNPLGDPNANPGAPPQLPEEDDFAPDSNFGFTPPPSRIDPPSAGNSDLAAPAPSFPSAPNPTSVLPSRSGNRSSAMGNSGVSGINSRTVVNSKTAKKPAKLADYLELDSSVKSLEVKNFDLPDKDIKDVVTLISKWTGKNFILDNKVRGKITIIGPSQVTLQEAYNAFLSALEANSLTTVQSGKFIRIIESAEARRAPVKTYSGDYAPKDDNFITRIFQLKYINADEVQREFRDLTTRQGKLFAYEPTNSIIITDTGANIQRIKEILEVLDIKNFETTLHVLRIKNGSSKAIADMLGEIYGDDKKGAAGARSFRRSALERTRGGGIISKIIPDEATNSLIILANAAGFVQLQALVGRLDVRVTDTGKIHVYYCEYAKAEDLAATLASLSGGGNGASGSKSKRNTTVTSPNAAPGTAPSTSPSGPSGPVTAELDGGVKVTSDSATNALVITANASDYKTLKRVLKKLDIPRLQVFVESAILEITIDKKKNVGVNAALGAPGKAFAGGFLGDSSSILGFLAGGVPPEGTTIPIFGGPKFRVPFAAPNGSGGTTTTDVEVASFMGLLNLLSKNTDTSILSTPQIIALDNEKAEFKVQDEIPVQSSFTLNPGAAAGGVGTGNITTLKTGIDIKLTPHINAASRTIRLEIEQTVDSLKSNNDVPQALASIQKAKTSRVTNTSVSVKDQDFVMLGGLMSDKVDESVSKVPLLGDIPILGWLFKSKNTTVSKTNLVILLHPRIIGSSFAAAELINEKLGKRDKFIDNTSSQEDQHAEATNEIKDRVKEQEERGRREKTFDYRNNEDEEDVAAAAEAEKSKQQATKKDNSRLRDNRADYNPHEEIKKDEKQAVNKAPAPAEAPAPVKPADDTPLLESLPEKTGE